VSTDPRCKVFANENDRGRLPLHKLYHLVNGSRSSFNGESDRGHNQRRIRQTSQSGASTAGGKAKGRRKFDMTPLLQQPTALTRKIGWDRSYTDGEWSALPQRRVT